MVHLFSDMKVEVGSYLPAEGWKDNPEIVDTILNLLDRVVFTVSKYSEIPKLLTNTFQSEISASNFNGQK